MWTGGARAATQRTDPQHTPACYSCHMCSMPMSNQCAHLLNLLCHCFWPQGPPHALSCGARALPLCSPWLHCETPWVVALARAWPVHQPTPHLLGNTQYWVPPLSWVYRWPRGTWHLGVWPSWCWVPCHPPPLVGLDGASDAFSPSSILPIELS